MKLPLDAAQDQSNCPTNYYRRNNGMLHQIDGNVSPEESNAPDLTRLDAMTREQLIALVERMARQCGMVAAMSKEETAQAMRDVLADIALKPLLNGDKAEIRARMDAIDKWLDRTEGKPAGSAPQLNIGASGDMRIEVVLVPSNKQKVIEG